MKGLCSVATGAFFLGTWLVDVAAVALLVDLAAVALLVDLAAVALRVDVAASVLLVDLVAGAVLVALATGALLWESNVVETGGGEEGGLGDDVSTTTVEEKSTKPRFAPSSKANSKSWVESMVTHQLSPSLDAYLMTTLYCSMSKVSALVSGKVSPMIFLQRA